MTRFVSAALEFVGQGFEKAPITVRRRTVGTQRRDGFCGPMSLRYCMMKWDHDIDVARIGRYTNCSKRGTLPCELKIGAMKMGCNSQTYEVHTAAATKRIIDKTLTRGGALVLGVDKDTHWLAVLAKTKRGYLLMDPQKPGPIITLWGAKALFKRMKYVHKATKKVRFEMVSVMRPVQGHVE